MTKRKSTDSTNSGQTAAHPVIPHAYSLKIDLVSEEEYLGAVDIEAEALKPSSSFILNSKDLEILELKIHKDKKEIKADIQVPGTSEALEEKKIQNRKIDKNDLQSALQKEKVKDELEVLVEGELRGKFLISIKFKGQIKQNMEGFYKSSYKIKDQEKFIFSTHFEPAFARTTLPCFDHPLLKATFSVEITADKKFTILSNNAVEKEETTGERKTVKFLESPRMSTYLLAFVIGEIEFLETHLNSIKIRTYTIEGQKKMAEFPQFITKKSLEIFEEYFGIKYPLEKLDNVAIPEFSMGAMENWGLVTYRTTSLLYNDTISSVNAKKRIAETVAHELAHQWFGNLVTMKWWNDLWLNEGFATWAAMRCVSRIKEVDWDVETAFISADTYRGMRLDALGAIHPIEVEVNSPAEVDQIFDAISYSKSSSLIRMVENFIGMENFQLRLREYLKKFQYSNAESKDLWEALSDKEHNIQLLMDNWTKISGFPLVRVSEDGDELVFTQERFFMGEKKKTEDRWFIPLKIKSGEEELVVQMTEREIRIKKLNDYKVNNEGVGFYVVYYENKAADLHKYSVRNRLNIYNDYLLLTLASYIEIEKYIELTKIGSSENNSECLMSLLSGLAELKAIFFEKIGYFKSLILEIVKERASEIKFDLPGKTLSEKEMNTLIVSSAVNNGHTEMIERLDSLWSSYQTDKTVIHPVFLGAFFSAAVLKGRFTEIFKIYSTGIIEEKVLALQCACKTTNREEYEGLVRELWGESIKLQDRMYLSYGLSINEKYRNILIKMVVENYPKIVESYRNNDNLLSGLISSVFSGGYDPEVYDLSVEFLKRNRVLGIDRAVDKVLESIGIKKVMRERNEMFRG